MPNTTGLLLIGCSFLLLPSAVSVAVQPYTITVSAGDFDREGTVVSFESPVTQKLELRGPDGRLVPLQVDERGRAAFLENEIKK
ncbi:MAG: hypothetical protein HYZ36_05140, partial [Pedosphaera parvula]|nr:hypothetical protein [Pedosphaera parvula]